MISLETGRYELKYNKNLTVEERICPMCATDDGSVDIVPKVEDEFHFIFECHNP